MRLVGFAIAGLVLVASAAGASPVRATLTTSSVKPVVDQPWRFTVSVKNSAGKPTAAKMRLQILVGSIVVGCWKGTAMMQCSGPNAGTWISFRGRRSDVITWPAQSVGIKLTFQAVVVAAKRTIRLRSPVTVQAAP